MLTVAQNLKSFLVNRPPLVIFTVSLAVFAVGALSLSFYMQEQPIKDPDVVDWNDVMRLFSELDLCVNGGAEPVQGKRRTIALPWSAAKRQNQNGKVALSFQMRLGERVRNVPENVDIFRGSVVLGDLGIRDDASTHLQIGVSIDLGRNHKLANCTPGGVCTVVPSVCVTLSGPVHLLPRVKEPKLCSSRVSPKTEAAVTYTHKDSGEICSGYLVEQEYVHDSELSEILNYKEQLAIQIHLMYTSYFLFAMVMAILCVAIVKGYAKPKAVLLDRVASL